MLLAIVFTSQQLQSRHCDIYLASRCQSWAFYLWLRESQNLARLREIAKFSTRKIVGIPKSQNFVLANNSNNKVDHKTNTKKMAGIPTWEECLPNWRESIFTNSLLVGPLKKNEDKWDYKLNRKTRRQSCPTSAKRNTKTSSFLPQMVTHHQVFPPSYLIFPFINWIVWGFIFSSSAQRQHGTAHWNSWLTWSSELAVVAACSVGNTAETSRTNCSASDL